MPRQVKCGQCMGCRLEYSRQWAMRCVHESKLYEKNCFLTLTYRDEDLPENNTLVKEHVQNFMKELRSEYGPGIRVAYCGEYGDNKKRPHYHLLLFNHDFPDKIFYKKSGENELFISPKLWEIWRKGHHVIGGLSFESCAYVARYATKKITGEKAVLHYNKVDPRTGELLEERIPEFFEPSRRPGIGMEWAKKWANDWYKNDSVIIRGREMKPPTAYEKIFEEYHAKDMRRIKRRRKKAALQMQEKGLDERLEVREQILELRNKQLLQRRYENEG